jgi:hypothetical protein
MVPAEDFPNFAATGGQVVSPANHRFNCIAWAAGDDTDWWWPGHPGGHWPEGVPALETVAAFIQAFATLGYTPCAMGDLEEGLEKVALYAEAGIVRHAARQLPTGRWTSKLGPNVDVEHVLEGLEGPLYGTVSQFLQRPRPRV